MMFVWRSPALKRYGDGQIISIGTTAEEAREGVRATLGPTYREQIHYHDGSWLLQLADEDYCEDWRKWRDAVEHDIAAEPELMDVVFIRGSE